MGVSKRQTPSGGGTDPIQPKTLFSGDSVPNTFGGVQTREITRELAPNRDKYSYIHDVSPYTDPSTAASINASRQPYTKQIENSLQQFGANFASGFGQGMANLLDVTSWGNDNYQSALFGLSTKEMQDWSQGVAQRNKILRTNPGEFQPNDFSWWMEQVASSGTGLGMGAFALVETAAIELATGGTGTALAAARLGNLFKNIKAARGAEAVIETARMAKDLRSVAMVYGTASRLNESRMEGMMSYTEIHDSMAAEKNADGSPKYTEKEINEYAAQGADRTFKGNLALLPLDILAFRAMTFNPVSGGAKGLMDKVFGGIANKALRKTAQFGTGAFLEGTEEGFQFVASSEGQHYASVLGGMDDQTNFGERLVKDVKTDEFWNNFAGGVIGSPIIAGGMGLVNKIVSGNRTAKVNAIHDDYVKNVGKLDSQQAVMIKELEEAGEHRKAEILRRQFRTNKALGALHLDAMTDRDSAFNAHTTFMQGVVDEVNAGKTDALEDLGITNATDEQKNKIKTEFEQSIKDANELKGIYDNVKDKYNKNFVPTITMQHFQLNGLLEGQTQVAQELATAQGKLSQYGQLSANGKQQYNAEYELMALKHEQTRLAGLHRNTKDGQEKSNVADLIEVNKAKITSVKEKLNEIGKDENYTSQEKSLDNDILSSALRDKDYTQSMYEKERLENEIALTRKNLSLWNNKEYQQKKTEQSVKNSKTKPQLDANKEGNVTPETQEAIDAKADAIAAQEATNAINHQVTTHGQIPGNANIFEQDNNLINGIAKASNMSSMPPDNMKFDETPGDQEATFLLSPASYNFDDSPQESKDAIITGVKGLVSRVGGEPNFENLIRHIVKAQGLQQAEEIFNAIKWGWEAAGYKKDNYQAIFDKVFANPVDILMQGIQGLSVIKTPEELAKETKKVEGDVISKGKPQTFDNNNQPVYSYEKPDGSRVYVTHESSPKLAFVTRLSKLIRETDEQGNVVVSHDYTEEELNTGDYTDSLQLLDPDKFNAGTEMVIEIPTNFLDIKIPVYKADGTKDKAMTFGQYVAVNNLSPEMQAYQDKIPMIIYRKGHAKGEKGLAFVHDVGWYNFNSFHYDYKADMDKAIASTRDIRKAVIGNEKNSEAIVITGKRQTTFEGLKVKDGDITLAEANPESQITVALSDASLSTGRTEQDIAFPNNKTTLLSTQLHKIGQVYDVRRFGNKDGKETFVAYPVIKPKLDEASRTAVIQALTIYANRSNPEAQAQHKPVIEAIKASMGIDLHDTDGIQQYLKHFMFVQTSDKAVGNEANQKVADQMAAKLPVGTPYLVFVPGGNVVFGQAGIAAFYDSKKKASIPNWYINPNSVAPSGLTNLMKAIVVTDKKGVKNTFSNMFHWYEQNVDLDALKRNKPVTLIDKNMTAQTGAKSHDEFLKSKLRSNVRSYNIGTADKPNYVTNIQPVITYELKSKLDNAQPTNEEVVQEVLPESKVEEVTQVIEQAEQSLEFTDAEKAIMEQALKDLGPKFGITKDDKEGLSGILAPAEMSKDSRNNVVRGMHRIAGLTPDQQFDIVDFMYNQIAGMINFDTGVVTKAQVEKAVEQTFKEVIAPIREDHQTKAKFIADHIAKFPEARKAQMADILLGYRIKLSKIAAVEQAMDVLVEEAFQRVAKYTGITENKVLSEDLYETQPTEDNPDIKVEDEPNQKERDFYTDILQENPESRLSYTMRRFFGQIRKHDTNGNLLNGFLGLPAYVGSDEVIRTLMSELADVPSDFDTMMARLEKKTGITWMPSVIDKLKGATAQQKNQFVTVMSNTSLRMKFMMISYNRKTNSWTTKVWDTHLGGVADAVKREWQTNFKNSDLTEVDEEGNYKLNIRKAQHLVGIFDDWIGASLKELTDMDAYWPQVQKVRPGKPVTISATGKLLADLQAGLTDATSRMKFSLKGYEFQIRKAGDKYEVSNLNKNSPLDKTDNYKEVLEWLEEFGIVMSPEAVTELMEKGLYHNYGQRSPSQLFDASTHGLFGILADHLRNLLKSPEVNFTEEGNSPLDNTVVSSLATLESKYNTTTTPFGFRDNGKSVFGLTVPKFITDRARDLKNPNGELIKELQSISFSKGSMWLMMLADTKFRDRFNVSHMGLNALKELGKRLYKDNGITKLPDLDHELTKLGMFWDTTQGEVTFNTGQYPGTSIGMRMATMFSPTMSDKQMMTLITTAVLKIGNSETNNGTQINADVTRVLYDQIIKPELARMIKFYQNGGLTNIKAYDKGAGLFMFMPEMNNIELTKGLKLVNALKTEANKFTLQELEQNTDLRATIDKMLVDYVNALTDEKIAVWKENGLVELDEAKNITGVNYFDRKYKDRLRGTPAEVARIAAMDFIVNSMIANSNSFMALIGDPALYYKEGERKDEQGKTRLNTPLEKAKDTFVNVGKRLANQIAPGTTLANSEHEQYLQIFIDDRKSLPEIPFLKSITSLLDGAAITDTEIANYKNGTKSQKAAIVAKFPKSAGYFAIEGADAQEYTTWKEHLDILAKLGKTPDTLIDITPEEIAEAKELFSSDVTRGRLTDKQKQLIGKVMQPIKPVYTGQMYDPTQDVMRTVYIKSSSFPLIPQLTEGFEIDKLRQLMQKTETNRKLNVRASYQSANKVGAISNPAIIWKEDGKMIDDIDALDVATHSLVLNRKNFRIQQEVPFKSAKAGDDKITLGTQLMKLLFGDEIMNYDGFIYNGKSFSGKELHKEYNQLFIKLVQEKRNQLFTELGLDAAGLPVDAKSSMKKLQELLREEAKKRSYPLQDIEGLTLVNGEFNLPLWASSNSNRYESMLNSIVTNRLIRMKFPGNSFVVGSEEGFIKQENLAGVDKSKMIYTSAWNGKSLQATYKADGTLHKAQVFISPKFKNTDGELIDLFEKVGTEYKYVTKTDTGFNLKQDMFSKELLTLITFRIPTSGHQSASQVEIAGFLPAENADLMIVPRNFTKQKGLDFDVDKENSYMFWTHMNDDGSFEVLQEKHRDKVLARADRALKGKNPEDRFLKAVMGDNYKITKEDLEDEKFLLKLYSKVEEKLMQNELIKINHSVMGSDNDAVLGKILKTLNTDFAEQQADFIDDIATSNKNEKYWTPLSDEYQKQKMMLGASGKIGTGAYSLDVVGHSLFQQAAINGKPIQLIEVLGEGEDTQKRNKEWRFGNITSNGQLGGTMTLDGGRTISELQAERQNIAVDNEKLQVMARVNLNDITMDVDKVFNLLGFDKGKDGNSIAFLFLSQPIIKEFVAKLKNAGSTVAEFEKDKEGTAFDDLIAKYEGETQETIDDEYWERMSTLMSNENLLASLQSPTPDGKLQAAILRRFKDMRNYGIAIRGIQTTINTDSKGLGKSFFDVIEKRNALNRLSANSEMIEGASGLIGEYRSKKDYTPVQQEEMIQQGFVDIGEFLVMPDTLTGGFNIYGVTTAYNLWNKFFPYDAAITNKAFTEILSIISSEEASDTRTIELKQEIFRNMKKYLSASKYNGIVSATDDINFERERLFIDGVMSNGETNTSLAKYVKALKEMTGNEAVDEYIKTNKLINRFEFDIQKNGQPSLMKYSNAAGEEFDEQYLYESLATLMELKGKSGDVMLPKIGNKQYTLATLAQDMVAYCYLGNAIQEAIQFTKYVPVSYLNEVKYAEKMREAGLWLHSNEKILGMKITNGVTDAHLVSEFTMQYIQHNPERVRSDSKFNDKTLAPLVVMEKDGTFIFKDPKRRPTFVTIYDPTTQKGEKKFRLYWYDGAKYSQIPVLGTFGMDEYQRHNGTGTSLINGKLKSKANPQHTSLDEAHADNQPQLFNIIQTGDSAKIMKAIADSGNTPVAAMAKALLPFSEGVKVVVSTEMKGKQGKVMRSFNAYYEHETATIGINPDILQDANLVAMEYVHEMVHHLTIHAIAPYIESNPVQGTVTLNTNDAPLYVQNIVRLYNSLKSNKNYPDLQRISDKVGNAPLTTQEINESYGYISIYEFMSMAMTNPEFQKILAKTEYKNSGFTLLEKFKEFIAMVMKGLGVQFDTEKALFHAINSTFDIIEKTNVAAEEVNPWQPMYDETMNQSHDDFGHWNEFEGSDDVPTALSPASSDTLDKARVAILTDIKDPFMQEAMLSNVDGALMEAAAQLNASKGEAETARRFYGNAFSDIALKMYPNETVEAKNVRDYISKLNSEKTDC